MVAICLRKWKARHDFIKIHHQCQLITDFTVFWVTTEKKLCLPSNGIPCLIPSL